MRTRTAFVIMLIFLVVTAANYFSSAIFTSNSIKDTMEQDLSLALDIADSLVATSVSLLKSDAETVAERLMKCKSEEEMLEVMKSQKDVFPELIAYTIYDRNGIALNYGKPVSHDVFDMEFEFIDAAFHGTTILASPHYNIMDHELVMHVFISMGPDLVLSATLPGMYFSDLLSHYVLWETGSIFIVDAEGTFVASSRADLVTDRRNFIEEVKTDPELQSAADFYRSVITETKQGSGTYVYEGKERLCVYKYLTNSIVGWRVGVTAPISETPQRNLIYNLLFAALVFLAAGVVVSVLVSGQAVKPFRRIEALLKDVRRHEDLLNTGNSTAEILLSAESELNIESTLMESMALIGRSTDADRIQIWRNEMIDGSLHFVHRYEWLSDVGKQSVPVPIGLKFPYSDKPAWEHKFMSGESINGPVSALLPEDRDFLSLYEMKTIVIIPLFLQDQFWGFFSLDDCRHERTLQDDEIRMLHSVSLMMANIFNRAAQAEMIREANEYTELLIEEMPFSCNLWDKDLNLFQCNDGTTRIFNAASKEEFMHNFEWFSPLYQPDGRRSAEKAMELLRKAFDEGTHVVEWVHQKRGGELFPAEISLVRVAHGSEDVVAAYVRDLSEEKKMMADIKEMMQNLQSANRAKSDFLAKMSHEMRTPLNAIIGLSDLSLEDDVLAAETRLNIERVNNAGVTLLSTVNDILDISRIEAGRLELNPIVYEIPSLLNDTVIQSIMHVADKPIRFILNIDENLPAQLFGDDLRIKQILNNLLSNAFKYTREGSVELGVRCSRDVNFGREGNDFIWLTAWVKDTGIGIMQENLGMLFEEFVKIDEQVNRQITGTGLGLPITKKMAELMGGTIGVESEYGKGSIFTVRVKQKFVSDAVIGPEVVNNLVNFRYSDQKRRSNAKMVRVKLPHARVLVVDDNAANLDVAKGMIKPYEITVDCVTGGQQAIDAITEHNVEYDAIFMDHMMPGMDGIEAVKRIREIDTDYARNVPIIACTANAISGSDYMFLNNGFQAFLSKPIDVNRLDEIIRLWIAGAAGAEEGGEGGTDADALAAADVEAAAKADAEVLEAAAKADADVLAAADADVLEAAAKADADILAATDALSEEYSIGDSFAFDALMRSDMHAYDRLRTELDVKKGVQRFGGDVAIYVDVLRSFAVNTKPMLEILSQVDEESLADYGIMVHGIKGSSRGVCAAAVGNLAEELENAAKRGDIGFVRESNPEFIKTVDKLIADIELLLDAQKKQSAGKGKETRIKPDGELLLKLRDACREYNADEVDDIIKEIDRYEYEADGGLAEWLKYTASQYDFSQIADRLSEQQ